MNAWYYLGKYMTYTTIFVSLLPVIFGFICYRTLKKRFLFVFLLMTVGYLADIMSDLVVRFKFTESNHFIFNYYAIAEIILIGLHYYFIQSKKFWKYTVALVTLALSFSLLLHCFGEQGKQVNSLVPSIQGIGIILLSISGLYKLSKREENTRLWAIPDFWIDSGMLLFYGGGLCLEASFNYMLVVDIDSYYIFWGVLHSFLFDVWAVMVCIAFWKTRKHQALGKSPLALL